MTVHILKLCVGIDNIDHLIAVRRDRVQYLADGTACNYHITRFRPKRAREILDGGSLYWVIKGFVQIRQEIIALEKVETDTGVKCKIIMDSRLIRTQSQPRRPHQGWRYLETSDAPKDIPAGALVDNMPADLSRELREMGLI